MRNWLKVFILYCLFGGLVYFNSLNNKFLMDDFVLLSSPVLSQTKFISSQWNPYSEQVLGVQEGGHSFGYYRPLSHMIYDVCYGIFKYDYWKYHLLNLFLFVFVSTLVYLFIDKITGVFNLAFLGGLFFLIHPINGIVVNYVVSSVFAVLLIFMMGTILLFWESLERKNDLKFYFLSLFSYFISLFLHEIGIMTPLYLAAVSLLFRKDPFKQKIIYLFPFFLVGFSFVLFRACFLNNDGVLNHLFHLRMTGWEYLAAIFRLISWHIARLFYPQGIVMQWVTPILHEHILWDNLGLVSLFIIFTLFFVRFSNEKICQLAMLWILIGFSPVCSVPFSNPVVGALIEPHWFIFSSIGFFILIAYIFINVLGRMKKAGLALLFVVIFIWTTASHAYNQLWFDQKTYASFWSKEVPNYKLPYLYLADAYQNEGALKEARKYYKLALGGESTDFAIYNNLGAIEAKEGHWEDAELSLRKALRIKPLSAATYNDLGMIYYSQDQELKAKEYFLQALAYNPLMLEPRLNLARVFLKGSEYKKAIDLCLKNLDIVSDDPNTLFLLVNIFIKEKDSVDLKMYAHRILNSESDPQDLTRLGIMMAKNNVPEVALDCFAKAMHLAPNYKEAYWAAGALFANLGKYNEAVSIWKLGSSIDPMDQRFKNNIAKAMTMNIK